MRYYWYLYQWSLELKNGGKWSILDSPPTPRHGLMNRCCHCKLKKALMGQNQCCHIFLDGHVHQILPDIVFGGPICTTNPVFVALAIGQNAIIKQTLDAHCTCICLGNRLSSWLVTIGGLSKNIPSRCIPNNVGPPSYVRWFINPMNTIVICVS